MWTIEHGIETTASPQAIWSLWSEVATWPDWNGDIARIEISGPFAVGSTIAMTPNRRGHGQAAHRQGLRA
jgi:hypothetical protein